MELTLDQALQKGVEAHKAGKAGEADRYYTAVLKVNPKHPDANHNMGVLAVSIGKVFEAIPFFKLALEVNPKIQQYWLSYLGALIKLDRSDDAIAAVKQAQSHGVIGVDFDTLVGRLGGIQSTQAITSDVQHPSLDQMKTLTTLYKQGQFQKTLNEALQLIRDFPQSMNLYNIIGAANKALGKLDEAIEAYKKAISIKPDYAAAYNNMGVALQERGNLSDSLKNYNKALSIKPDYADAYNNAGVTLKELGRLDEAIEAYKKTILIQPDYAEAYYNMGVAHQEQGNLDEALNNYNKALSIKPDYADAYNNMGVTLKNQGKLEEAIEAYNKALSIRPDNAEVFNNIGTILQDQDKLEEALEAYEKALSIKPNHAEVYHNTSELLKIYTPKRSMSHVLFQIDNRIKKLSASLIGSQTRNDILIKLVEGLDYVDVDDYRYTTSLSQIYKRNTVDLNCNRHSKVFNAFDIIPEFCFGCFKVQIEVPTVLDLIKINSIFYKFVFEEDLTKKTMVELRSKISGHYKGLIFCSSFQQAEAVQQALNLYLKEAFSAKPTSKIKRGCSEYPLKFPNYGEISGNFNKLMTFPREWKVLEEKFDRRELIIPQENQKASLTEYCISDFYIIQKWIDYAKGIGDTSIEIFKDRPIIFKEIYEIAKDRKG